MPPWITKLHGKDLKFTLLGSVRRALEAQGYSVHLERHGGNPGSSYSHTLTLSDVNSGFTISIKYFHDLHTNATTTETIEFQDLIVVTSVTLESSSVLDGSNSYQDGPHVLRLWDRCGTSGWTWSHAPEKIYLASPTGEALSVTLGLDMAWTSEYYLVVDIQRAEKYNCWSNFMYNHTHDWPGHRLSDSCESISLILPGHTKHSLQERGYKVHFRGPNEDHSDPSYHLTLSDAKLMIGIKYSHYLSTGSNGRQELTFKACVDITNLARLPGSSYSARRPDCVLGCVATGSTRFIRRCQGTGRLALGPGTERCQLRTSRRTQADVAPRLLPRMAFGVLHHSRSQSLGSPLMNVIAEFPWNSLSKDGWWGWRIGCQ